MDPLDLLFKVLMHFGIITEEEYNKMYNEMNDWRLKLNPDSKNPIISIYAKYRHFWYVKLISAVLFLPIVHQVHKILNPKPQD
jgi:hypothetical protein